MKHMLILIINFVLLLLIQHAGQTCTTLRLSSDYQILVGKNYDSFTGDILVFVNKRGLSKTAFSNPPTKNIPVKWTSKYGSITFSPWGWDFSSSGINEAGLVISSRDLEQTEYPAPDERATISVAQWSFVLSLVPFIKQKHPMSLLRCF